MTITQLRYFLAVADTLSFTQAANMLYVSQPAISKSISKLEESLGFKLFERTENALALTVAGKTVHEFMTHCYQEFTRIMDDIHGSIAHPESTIRIGCPETWDPAFFYSKIQQYFSESHPETKLYIECHKLSELLARLQAGKLDIVFTHDFFIPSLPNISAKDFCPSSFGILYSKEHFGEVTSIHDFDGVPFLLFDNDIEKRFSGVIHNICLKNGMSLPKIINYNQLPSAMFHTACGNGVMLFSSWDIAISNPSFGFLTINEDIPIKIIYFTDNPKTSVPVYVDSILSSFNKD